MTSPPVAPLRSPGPLSLTGTLVSLKLRLTVAELKRSTARLVVWILGSLYVLFLVAGLIAMVAGLGGAVPGHEPTANAWLIVIGAVIIVAWAVLPALMYGTDQTLDPARFAPFPLTGRQLAPGLIVAGVVGVPGFVTLLVALSTALLWRKVPVAVGPALFGGVLGVLLAMTGSRLVATLLTALFSSRRGRDLSSVLLVVAIMVVTLGVWFGTQLATHDGTGSLGAVTRGVQVAGSILAWTPFGAPWALAGDAAAGSWLLFAAHLVLSLAYLAALLWLFGLRLDKALLAPARAMATAVATKGDIVASTVRRLRATRRFEPAAAIAGRCLRYWRRDPRYIAAFPSLVIMPIMMTVLAKMDWTGGSSGVGWHPSGSSGTSGSITLTIGGEQTSVFAMIGCGFMALLAGYSLSADVASDSTAWWIHLQSGIRGWADRLGRALAASAVLLPFVVVVAIVVPPIVGEPQAIAASAGVSIGLYLCGLGVSAVFSALIIYPVALPGESAMKMRTGMMGTQILSQFGSLIVTMVVALPCVIPGVLAPPRLGGFVVLGCLLWGLIVAAVGVIVGGRIMDARGPAILATLRKNDARTRA